MSSRLPLRPPTVDFGAFRLPVRTATGDATSSRLAVRPATTDFGACRLPLHPPTVDFGACRLPVRPATTDFGSPAYPSLGTERVSPLRRTVPEPFRLGFTEIGPFPAARASDAVKFPSYPCPRGTTTARNFTTASKHRRRGSGRLFIIKTGKNRG